jgi:4-amino-4-deoxy-L-arabinose transferase-like glycosyltransferase
MTSSYRQRFSYVVGVLLIAACLRLWHLAQTPPGLYLDEAFHLLRAQEIARGETFPVFITGNNGYEPLFVYLSVIPLTILGPVAWAGRLAAAWAGLLSVALTWRAGSELFPKRPTGILAGLMLATLFWNLDFSRFGSQPILAATAAAGTMAALWRGVRTGSPWAYSLAGISLGLGLDAYLGFRLFPLVPLASGLALLVARREKRPALLVGGLLAGGVALLVFTPLGRSSSRTLNGSSTALTRPPKLLSEASAQAPPSWLTRSRLWVACLSKATAIGGITSPAAQP